ncbi:MULTISPECIES: hypothetical protein [unclassified Arthrobacter]|uniref:hypothetical protein n=1 Tax=unclassified Arthrobacter TaxID=235627 RepID=UPI001492A317|nr:MULTISPECIES: hypothetical protein [unclassified Arthrobacter]MBE0009590.1 hypothetical protein [Arthrobacter sp. AET 35A]NOJ63340.1 hypothetical protein [Arthrobacter sp. 147(2020)]
MAATAPRGLEAKGKRLWKDITSSYELRADELDTLEDICREADLIVRLEAELDGAELITTGSQRQDVANPMVSEIRQHRATKKALWASLKLPDEGTAGNQQREAAQTRWAQTRGKVS